MLSPFGESTQEPLLNECYGYFKLAHAAEKPPLPQKEGGEKQKQRAEACKGGSAGQVLQD